MRPCLLNLEPFHKPSVLLRRQGSDFIFTAWPLVRALFQPFVEKNEAIPLPIEALDAVSPPPAKQKQRIGEWVELKLLLHHAGKPVNPFAQICIPAGNVNSVGSSEVIQHDFSAWQRAFTTLASAPE